MRNPAQAAQIALERQISALRQRLKAAERQAASESAACQDQAKLAETMARAARAEAREREALTRANAELAALVRSMEDELAALKAEPAALPEPGDASLADLPACERAAAPSPTKRKPFRMPLIAMLALSLVAAGIGAVLYPVVTAMLDGRVGNLLGRATVINGDTIRIEGTTVRLWGIGAPPAATPAGQRATVYLRQLTVGQDVRCEIDSRGAGGELVARCFIGSVDIGQVMMLSGNAVVRQLTLRGGFNPR